MNMIATVDLRAGMQAVPRRRRAPRWTRSAAAGSSWSRHVGPGMAAVRPQRKFFEQPITSAALQRPVVGTAGSARRRGNAYARHETRRPQGSYKPGARRDGDAKSTGLVRRPTSGRRSAVTQQLSPIHAAMRRVSDDLLALRARTRAADNPGRLATGRRGR